MNSPEPRVRVHGKTPLKTLRAYKLLKPRRSSHEIFCEAMDLVAAPAAAAPEALGESPCSPVAAVAASAGAAVAPAAVPPLVVPSAAVPAVAAPAGEALGVVAPCTPPSGEPGVRGSPAPDEALEKKALIKRAVDEQTYLCMNFADLMEEWGRTPPPAQAEAWAAEFEEQGFRANARFWGCVASCSRASGSDSH